MRVYVDSDCQQQITQTKTEIEELDEKFAAFPPADPSEYVLIGNRVSQYHITHGIDCSGFSDREMIRKSIEVIAGDYKVFEVRFLYGKGAKSRTDSGYFDDPATAADAVYKHSQKHPDAACYLLLNEPHESLHARAYNRIKDWASETSKDEDILCRQRILIDIDPIRAAGIPSSNFEYGYAEIVNNKVLSFLRQHGISPMLVAASGNGIHDILDVDLPNDDESKTLVEDFLSAVAHEFRNDDVVKIDCTVFNAARICRLWGTDNRKGDSTPDRPHRKSRILYLAEKVETVPIAALKAVAALAPPKNNGKIKNSTSTSTQPKSNRVSELPRMLDDYGVEYRPATPTGEQICKLQLAECPFDSNHKCPDSYVCEYANGNKFFKCSHVSCRSKGWREFTEQTGIVAGKIETMPEDESLSRFFGKDISELEPFVDQQPDWLVDGIFTTDEPIIYGARSKCCKTLTLEDLAVAVASQTPWMGVFNVPKRRKVLFITGEANNRRAAKDLAKACKVRGLKFADLSGWLRIEAIEFPSLPSEKDCAAINKTIVDNDIEVVIVDPLYRGLTGVDANRLLEMGAAIKNFQRACQPALLILSHHVIKSAAKEYGSPPALEDMTGAGIAESCGQWWLVGRNEKYQWDWQHDLCVQYGGREGQGGGKRIVFDEQNWTFQVDGWHEYREQAEAERQQKKDDARRDNEDRKRATARSLILKAVRNVKTPQSKSAIEELSGAIQADFRSVFGELVREQTLVVRPYIDSMGRRQTTGYLHAEYAAEYDSQ